jgi:hypothetical protein
LIAGLVPGAIIVSEAGLLGWSWYRAVGGGQTQAGSSRQKLPVWLVAIVTLDFATLALFRFVLGGEGFFPQADTTQKSVVIGSALAAVAAGLVGVRRPARGRTPFVIACALLAAAWSLLAYLLFAPLISWPLF